MKKSIALAFISKALADKTVGVAVKVFINTCRVASMNDVVDLFNRVHNNKEVLSNAYKDNLGWHFATV